MISTIALIATLQAFKKIPIRAINSSGGGYVTVDIDIIDDEAALRELYQEVIEDAVFNVNGYVLTKNKTFNPDRPSNLISNNCVSCL